MSGHNKNKAFLFRSYGEYWVTDDNSLVIAFDVQAGENGIHVYGDISRENGNILRNLMDDMVSGEKELLGKSQTFVTRSIAEKPLISAELADQLSDRQT